jgi:hypothetical protein
LVPAPWIPMDPHGAVTFDHPKNPRLAVNPPGWGWSLHLQLWSCRPGASCPTSTCLHMCDSISVEVTSNWRWLKSHTFLQVIEDASCFWVCPIPGTGEHHRTSKKQGIKHKEMTHIYCMSIGAPLFYAYLNQSLPSNGPSKWIGPFHSTRYIPIILVVFSWAFTPTFKEWYSYNAH